MRFSWLRQATREPLVHFMIVGAALFAFSGFSSDVDPADRRITLDEAQIGRLADTWQQTWRRPPSPIELDGLIREYVKDEIYSREALRLGLENDDPIIRRRLRTKMEFLATAEVESSVPSDAGLKLYYSANKARYSGGPVYSFDQRYYGEDELNARAVVVALNAGKSPPVLLIPLPAAMEKASTTNIGREFGDGFAAILGSLPANRWSGPVRSGYGWHAVRVRSVQVGTTRPLAEIVQIVTNDWRAETKTKREAAAYQTLLDVYDIRIAKP